ncbi:Major facilitator superfamily protein [Forsythia ovata]|uniref:Major facilitator superfamily protein n=1 Tax=Forsythia ovata TaxID=205694 RepID=A0ABD1P156_9LAMI
MPHLFVGIWKRITVDPAIWLASMCVSLTSSIFSFSFETWMVVENDKADGRNVSLGLIYPCFLGARMLGSTGFPWLFNGPLSIRMEADGRNVSLGLIYPCFLGARMLGSTGFPWLFNGPLSI